MDLDGRNQLAAIQGEKGEKELIGSVGNLIIPSKDKEPQNFKEALLGKEMDKREEEGPKRILKQLAVPRYKGGNLVIDLDEGNYRRGVEELKFSVVGQLYLLKGCEHPTMKEIKNKLSQIWGFSNFKLVLVGGDHYHIMLGRMVDQSTVLSNGPIVFTPRTFRVS